MHELHLKQTGSSLLVLVAIVLLAVLIDLAAAPALADHKHRKRVQESRCEYEKVIAAGSYYRCLTKAIAHALVSGLEPSESAVSRCDEDFDDAFARAEAYGECRTAGGPATISGPIKAQAETMTADVLAGPGCPSNNLTVIAGETATCKVSTTTSAIDLAAIVAQLSAEGVTEDTVFWIQAWGASGGPGNEGNGGGSGAGGYAQTVTTLADFLADFGVTEIYYYLGNQGTNVTSSGGSGGAATLVTTTDLTENDASLGTTVLVAGGGGGGGAGRGPSSSKLLCNGYNDVLGAEGGSGGVAIAADSIALVTGAQGGIRRVDTNYSGFGGGGALNGPGGADGGGNAVAGGSGVAGFGGLGGGQSGGEVEFFNQSNTKIAASGGQGGGPGDSAGGGGGGGGFGSGGGGQEGTSHDSCVAGGGGGGGSFAVQADATCPAAPTSKPANPNGNDKGFVQIVFDLGSCTDN